MEHDASKRARDGHDLQVGGERRSGENYGGG